MKPINSVRTQIEYNTQMIKTARANTKEMSYIARITPTQWINHIQKRLQKKGIGTYMKIKLP